MFYSSANNNVLAQASSCECEKEQLKKIIKNPNYNRLEKYDTKKFTIKDFYKLDKSENRKLWYRDIENIGSTKFTSSWNDYAPSNYHASHLDFVDYYKNNSDVQLAFQFGPSMDLWAYHIFVIKKIGCCFLITRSYFRHARFTYRAYSIMNSSQLDSLYSILEKTNRQPVTEKKEFKYCGYFIDNRNSRSFFIDFEKETIKIGDEEKAKPEIVELYDFVDSKINWIKTYSL